MTVIDFRSNQMARTLYILTTAPAQEGNAMRELHRLGFDAYAPSIRYQRRIRGAYRKFTRALIPGYVFAFGTTADEPTIRHQTPGVTGILAEMDQAGEDWVGSVLLLECFGAFDTTIDRRPKIKLGEIVRIVASKWAALGYAGRIVQVKGPKVKVEVTSALGKPVSHGKPVECGVGDVLLVA